MRTVVQETQRSNEDRNQRWDRMERAELFEQYFARKAQGISQHQAAQGLEVPRSTLQAWWAYQERLDESPAVVAFFQSVAGLAFLHRLVLAIPYGQNTRTHLPIGSYSSTIACASACLPLPSDP